MFTVLITGANRGLGLEFVQQYHAKGWNVLAACRAPEQASELVNLSETHNIELLKLDVTSEQDINQLGKQLKDRPIDHLILNAGVLGEDCATLGEMTQSKWLEVLNINTVAPALLIQALRENVAASKLKTIVGISSRVASIGDNSSGNMYSYRTSKAALNQILVSAARNLAEQGVKTLAVHPGWVQTNMGGKDATYTPQESVAGIINVTESLTLEGSGSFRVFDGSNIEW
ncbi:MULTISPECIES: SDR family oxidoreductase [Vibrio]|uniref:SDR family oxidoreductase n=1 Tax=Vibrio TaxID=662 RepID=UPI0001B94247|nr:MULTISPECIES: SDR family oxidoreductase [Vibrio]EEX32517.1 csgA protein [Vibrio coralliilyticus ATCC BAA-450]MCM5507973.1 SDR family oxidoreductase [Vibrio sp. SCSIO 43169]MDE3897523.1 SDR family oxidoreductase [Vibrio sp. CC007]QFT39183.1 C-factor [Vibrio sp. THAF64]QGM36279.1 C-factor [Vibrio sp. THAF191d]